MTCFASVASAALLALAACGSGSADAEQPRKKTAAAQPEEEIDPKSLVELRLVADVDAVAPAGAMNLGAVFEIKDGWHIYWINPGDSGLKTTATFSAPAGFIVEAARFPGPIEFKSPGNVVSYGYEHATVAFGKVVAPADPPESATFEVKGKWLACAHVCVLGDAEAELTLKRGEAKAANRELLEKHWKQLPRPLEDLGVSGTRFQVPDADVEYFPENDVKRAKLARSGDATKVELPSGAKGVLRVGKRYYSVP